MAAIAEWDAVVGDLARYEGRVTSAIRSFDADLRIVTTRSGRVYLLEGPAGFDADGGYVWEVWAPFNSVETWGDVSQEHSGLK